MAAGDLSGTTDTTGVGGGTGPGDVSVPNAPTNVVGKSRAGGARVTWTASTLPNGTTPPVRGYIVFAFPPSFTDAQITAALGKNLYLATKEVNATATSAFLDNLASGTAFQTSGSVLLSYKFAVVALNRNGRSTFSTLSAAVTPWNEDALGLVDINGNAKQVYPSVLAAPTGVTGTPGAVGSKAATVSWAAPATDGGQDVLFYTVTSNTGVVAYARGFSEGGAIPRTEAPTSLVVTGLPTGATTFTVQATTVSRSGGLTNGPVSALSVPTVVV